MSAFYVDGATADPTDYRIPGDPLRYTPGQDPAADAVRRWNLFARNLIGKAAAELLRGHDLVAVPGPMWRRALAAAQTRTTNQSGKASDTSQVSDRSSQS